MLKGTSKELKEAVAFLDKKAATTLSLDQLDPAVAAVVSQIKWLKDGSATFTESSGFLLHIPVDVLYPDDWKVISRYANAFHAVAEGGSIILEVSQDKIPGFLK